MSIIQDKREVREYLIMLVAICSQSINSKHVSLFFNKLFLVLIAVCIYLPSFFYNCHIAFRLIMKTKITYKRFVALMYTHI